MYYACDRVSVRGITTDSLKAFASGYSHYSRQIRRDNNSVLWQCPAVKLPNADKAVVERDKVAGYLLNAAHPDNGGKAAFFEGLGFRRSEPEILTKALRKLACQTEITESATSPHGEKYVIVGQVESPTGKAADVQTPKAFGCR